MAILAITDSAWAQSALPDLSLEDLMKLDAGQVYGASERLQPVTEAPSSISFITADEIARYGYRTLADILQSVRGMYITNDRNFSLVGTRGFAKPGDYNSRILLLVNGHRVNDNVFGQAEVGAEFGLDPAMFERVEIIRGPASSLYGDSAFFAVVNVITKTGASIDGESLTVETGTQDTVLTRLTSGEQLANGMELAVSGTIERTSGFKKLYFPVWDSPATNNGIAEDLDGEGVRQLYGRMDYKNWTVTGAYGTRRRDVPTASFGTLFNSHDPKEQTTDRHSLLDAEYNRSIGGYHWNVRASFDRFTYDGTYPVATDDPDFVLVGRNSVVGTRWSVGSSLTRSIGTKQTVTAGVEFIDNLSQNQTARYVDPPSVFLDTHKSSTQDAVYVQDEIKPTRWFIINAGLRYDGYEDFRRVTPRTALIFLPSSRQSFKYLYGRAFRAPNQYELNPVYFGDRVNDLRPESISTHEFVWENYINDRFRTSASTYWYKAERLITVIPDSSTFFGTTFVNEGQVRAKGLELEGQMRLKGESRALVSYALQKPTDEELHSELPNSPRHIVKAKLTLPGPTAGSFVSFETQYLSSRKTLTGSRVASATTVNMNVIQPLGHSWQLFGGVQNIFDDEYLDPVSNQLQDAVARNGRTAQIGIQWKMHAAK